MIITVKSRSNDS